MTSDSIFVPPRFDELQIDPGEVCLGNIDA